MMENLFMEALFKYGPVGLMAAMLVWDKYTFQKKMQQVVVNNTEALIKVYEALKER